MTKQTIPIPVIAVLADLVSHTETHAVQARDWEPAVEDAMGYYRSAKRVIGVLGGILSNVKRQQGTWTMSSDGFKT